MIYELRIFKKYRDKKPCQVHRFTGMKCKFNPVDYSSKLGFWADTWQLLEFSFPRICDYGYGKGYDPVMMSANWYTE